MLWSASLGSRGQGNHIGDLDEVVVRSPRQVPTAKC
jgi:hypothetical protein